MFIVIEGIDGSGKSTIGKLLAQELNAFLVEFPCDDTYTGPVIRDYLSYRWRATNEEVDPLVFQALQVANRMEVVPDILNCFSRGRHVVAVRWCQSGYVYGTLEGLESKFLVQVHDAMPKAHANILLNVPVEEAVRRQIERGKPSERYENTEFLGKAAQLYEELWAYHPFDPSGLWAQIDGDRPIGDVYTEVFSYCMPHLSHTGNFPHVLTSSNAL